MERCKTKDRDRQELIEGIAEVLPQDVEKFSVMGLLQFGNALLLKEAVRTEITRYLGRGFYEHLKKRDLSELKVVYLILDAIRVPMRIGGKGLDSVMVAYGVLED